MLEVKCPRCANKMRWLKRRNIFFCDNDGYILTPNDPFLKTGEVVSPSNPGGKYNK